jgi:GrpB-like predicted nucleotidyltransferase (UPF0157 family)
MINRALEIHGYNPSYKKIFEAERIKLTKILGDICKIEHIGSTAVPELDGKGVIDIMIVFYKDLDIQLSIAKLEKNGYFLSKNSFDQNGRFFMASSGEVESHEGDIHLHLLDAASNDFHQAILFRDYLVKHTEAKQDYNDLKYELLGKVNGDRKLYTKLKSNFIKNIIDLAKSEK